jgi:hypothetical protein
MGPQKWDLDLVNKWIGIPCEWQHPVMSIFHYDGRPPPTVDIDWNWKWKKEKTPPGAGGGRDAEKEI